MCHATWICHVRRSNQDCVQHRVQHEPRFVPMVWATREWGKATHVRSSFRRSKYVQPTANTGGYDDLRLHHLYHDLTVVVGFDWATIPNGTVVDVGGGIGTQSLIIAQEYPELKLVIQDLPSVIEDAKKVCQMYRLMKSLVLFVLIVLGRIDSGSVAVWESNPSRSAWDPIVLGVPDHWTLSGLVSSSKWFSQKPTNQRRRYILHAHDLTRLGR